MKPLRVAYSLIAVFVVVERLLRRGGEAVSLEAQPADRGTTGGVGRAFMVSLLALLVAPVLNRWNIGRFYGTGPSWSGIGIMVAGLALRIWAARVLGAFYTRTLRTSARQRLVTEGPYRLIRHPGYLGTLLLWLGAAAASANGIVMATTALVMGRAYHARIAAEEAMLATAFADDYGAYAERTWRIIPFVF